MKTLRAILLLLTTALLSTSCGCLQKDAQLNMPTHNISNTKDCIVLRNYFFHNDVSTPDAREEFVIYSQEEFDKYFSPAAVMGKGGEPTQTNFDKQIALCVVLEETNIDKRLNFVNIDVSHDGKITFSYRLTMGKRMSYTIRPYLVVLVDRKKAMNGVTFHRISVR